MDSMKAETVTAYVQEQVRALSDAKVRPQLISINNELAKIRNLEAEIKACNERITKFATDMAQAMKETEELQDKLAHVATQAVS